MEVLSTIFRIWRKHMDRNATNLDKHLKSQTWRGRRALVIHLWMTLTSALWQTKFRILQVWQESHKYPQAVASNYKENMLSWGRSSLQRVVKSLGLKCRECIWYYVLCTLFYFICIVLLLLTRRSANFNTHSESLKVIQISYVHPSSMYPIKLDLLHYPQRILNNSGTVPRKI
jgi:di/tricarboxylate transporter